jgi:hypothetical protein
MICEVKSMPGLLTEEKQHYAIDCKNAVWASDGIHDLYHTCGVDGILSDADFAVETESKMLLIEYKNANIPEAIAHNTASTQYDPFKQDNFNKLVSKYYDSLHYLHLAGKEKPVCYVCLLEYPDSDSVSRKRLRNRLKKRLPFQMQEQFDTGVKLIESVAVVNIEEWNADELFGQFPIQPIAQK